MELLAGYGEVGVVQSQHKGSIDGFLGWLQGALGGPKPAKSSTERGLWVKYRYLDREVQT